MGILLSRTDIVSEPPSDVSCQEANKELDRVLTDPDFQCSERNKKFLRHIAQEGLAGRQDQLKGYTIAIDVFGRPDSFNASSDAIVRIEATRLRAALVRYYGAKPSPTGLEIRIPRGHYAAEFVRVGQATTGEVGFIAAREPPQARPDRRGARGASSAGVRNDTSLLRLICALTGTMIVYLVLRQLFRR